MSAEQKEAKWLFFTEMHYKGQKYNLTVREGTQHEEIEGILARIITTHEAAAKLGFQMPGQNRSNGNQPTEAKQPNPAKENQERPSQPSSTPAPKPSASRQTARGMENAPDANATNGSFHITRIKITGDNDSPKVEMYSPNERLQYPLIHAPASIVQDLLVATYGYMDCSALFRCGTKIDVDWTVDWKKSEKTNRSGKPYLDLKGVTVWARETGK